MHLAGLSWYINCVCIMGKSERPRERAVIQVTRKLQYSQEQDKHQTLWTGSRSSPNMPINSDLMDTIQAQYPTVPTAVHHCCYVTPRVFPAKSTWTACASATQYSVFSVEILPLTITVKLCIALHCNTTKC